MRSGIESSTTNGGSTVANFTTPAKHPPKNRDAAFRTLRPGSVARLEALQTAWSNSQPTHDHDATDLSAEKRKQIGMNLLDSPPFVLETDCEPQGASRGSLKTHGINTNCGESSFASVDSSSVCRGEYGVRESLHFIPYCNGGGKSLSD